MITNLLNQPLTVQRRSTTATDEYGNEVLGTTASTPSLGYAEQTAATEVTVGRETYTTDWLVVLMEDVAIDGSDRILLGDLTLEVIGKPHKVWNPRTARLHHIECRCREVSA